MPLTECLKFDQGADTHYHLPGCNRRDQADRLEALVGNGNRSIWIFNDENSGESDRLKISNSLQLYKVNLLRTVGRA